jgi:H+/Cl- antiporter ClcA
MNIDEKDQVYKAGYLAGKEELITDKKDGKYVVIAILAGILGVTIMEVCALIKGIDGKVLTFSVGSICVLVGYLFGNRLEDLKKFFRKLGE